MTKKERDSNIKKRVLNFVARMIIAVAMMFGTMVLTFADEQIVSIDVSLQTGDRFLVQHKTIQVKSTLSEAYGYDEIASDKGVSVIDVLIAMHIDYYQTEDKSIIEQKLTTNANGAVMMLGEGTGKTSGFTVNNKYVFKDENETTLATIFQTAVKNGDSVDFFWYEDSDGKDTVAFFTDSLGNKLNSLEVKATEEFTVYIKSLDGFTSSNIKPVKNAMLCSVDENGQAVPFSNVDGSKILTNEEGKAVLTLSEGIYSLTVVNAAEIIGSRIIMPWCIVTVGHALEKVERKEPTAAEFGNIEYWYCNGCGKYFSDDKAEHEIKKEDTVLAKVTPIIIDGDNTSVTEGEKKELSFTSNGAYNDFIRVEIDGNTCDETNYSVKSGSIIVTLKNDYVASFSVGEHTIGIVSETGTAKAQFIVNEKPSESSTTKTVPDTGDNTELQKYMTFMFASICGVVVVVIKKKTILTGKN